MDTVWPKLRFKLFEKKIEWPMTKTKVLSYYWTIMLSYHHIRPTIITKDSSMENIVHCFFLTRYPVHYLNKRWTVYRLFCHMGYSSIHYPGGKQQLAELSAMDLTRVCTQHKPFRCIENLCYKFQSSSERVIQLLAWKARAYWETHRISLVSSCSAVVSSLKSATGRKTKHNPSRSARAQ